MTEVDRYRNEMVQVMCKLVETPAVNPTYGGEGEYKRGMWLAEYMKTIGLEPEMVILPDKAEPNRKRVNIVARLHGARQDGPTLWLVSHLDTVGEGDPSLWHTPPFKAVVQDGKVFGRGAEDNIQGIVASLFAVRALKEAGLQPGCNLGLVFAADEEAGSEHGLLKLIERGVFRPEDEAIVTDAGRPDGSFIEVAEKSVLWIRFYFYGKQAHASAPHLGINASAIATHFGADLDDFLKAKYSLRDYRFEPPYSTFEITQKFDNVTSPNILPGTDSFVMDNRVLPQYSLKEVLGDIERLISEYEFRTGVKIEYKILQISEASQPTPSDAPIVRKLARAIEKRGTRPTVGGIGGSTCADFLRRIGMAAVVWGTLEGKAHQPNECAVIDNVVADAATLLEVAVDCAD
ncbi:MAG: M20 family metallo-hydrolase [Bacillota bacterium]